MSEQEEEVKAVSPVVQILYGTEGRWKDVTQQVASILYQTLNPILEFPVTNTTMGGDPLPGVLKFCRVVYKDQTSIDIPENRPWKPSPNDVNRLRATMEH
jgi:hypothetical protein